MFSAQTYDSLSLKVKKMSSHLKFLKNHSDLQQNSKNKVVNTCISP